MRRWSEVRRTAAGKASWRRRKRSAVVVRRRSHRARMMRRWRSVSRADRRRTKARTNPLTSAALLVHVEVVLRGLVQLLRPTGRKRSRRRRTPRAQKGLLRGRQTHRPGAPIVQSLLVVQLEILPKLPSPSLLLPTRCAVVGQIGVRVVVEETRHRQHVASSDLLCLIVCDRPKTISSRGWLTATNRQRLVCFCLYFLGC